MPEREMNFYDLCKLCAQAIGRGIKACWNGFAAFLRLSYRLWWVVLTVVVLALVAANYFARQTNRIYKVEAIAWLNGPTIEQAEQVYRQLSFALSPTVSKQQNLPALLGLSSEELYGVRRLESFHVIDCLHDSIADFVDYSRKASRTDTINVHMPDRLCLSFRTNRPENAELVGNAIVAFMNKDVAMQAAFESRKKVLTRQVQFAQSHIEKLDSLTSAFYFEQGTGAQVQGNIWSSGFIVGRREIELFSEDIYAEFDRYNHFSHELAFCTAPVVLESPFTINPAAVNSRIKMNILGLILGWLLGALIAAIIEQRKALISWLQR